MRIRSMGVVFATLVALATGAAQARQEAVIYEGPNFSGRSVVLRSDTPNFDFIGFNDKTSSIYVIEGTWEFCTDGYFQGSCRQYPPGEYRTIGGQTDKISSARVAYAGGRTPPPLPSYGGERPRERPPEGGRPSEGGWNNVGRGEISLYDRQDFRGRGVTLREATPDFDRIGFNDMAASIIVHRGTWQLCRDGDYRGDCRTYGPGEYRQLPQGHDDAYSSARPVDGGWGNGPGGRPGGGERPTRIGLFEYAEFGGRSVWLERSNGNFDDLGFNDRAESVVVEGGEWTLCSDGGGQGSCRTFGPGRYPVLPNDLRGRVSSARVR